MSITNQNQNQTEYDEETGETFYGIYAMQPNRNPINNPFNMVINELNKYTKKSSMLNYHRIVMTDIVKEVKDRNLYGRVVNNKTGIKCNYSNNRKRQIFQNQLPSLRRLTNNSFLNYQIKIYPFNDDGKYDYHSPQAYPPITLTLDDILKETPIILPNEVNYNLIFCVDREGKDVELERTNYIKYVVSSNYKISGNILQPTEQFTTLTKYPLRNLTKFFSDTLLDLSIFMVIPKPRRQYQRTRHQNKLLSLLVGMKRWDKKGNPLLTGCKAQRYYDNSFVNVIEWNFKNYTTKGNLENFMITCGYIQTKLSNTNTPITEKAINKEIKTISKTSYKELSLWIYKQY
jgi:hypothetical protein